MIHRILYIKIKFKILIVVTTALIISNAYAHDTTLRILVTGFEPFGGYLTNPSAQLVEYINSDKCKGIEGVKLKGITLPVTYFQSWEILIEEINKFKPDYILSFGFSPSSNRIQIESTARNFDRGYQDNIGSKHNGVIVKNAPGKYFNELPIKKIANRLKKRSIPVSISSYAGGYLCNHIFYQVTHYTNSRSNIRSGFFHIPNWPIEGRNGIWAVVKEILYVIKLNSIKVGIFEFEPIKDDIPLNVKRIIEIVTETKKYGIKFYIFPEMALSGLIYESPIQLLNNNEAFKSSTIRKALINIAKKENIYLSLGLATYYNNKLFNSYNIFTPNGTVYNYNKNHLYGSDFNWAKSGKGYPILSTHFGKIGALICHDVVYKESFQTYLDNDIDMLIIGTNWIGKTPITKYLTKYTNNFSAIFISDRKGIEDNIKFIGNTSVIDKNNKFIPSIFTIKSNIRGIFYLFISDKIK